MKSRKIIAGILAATVLGTSLSSAVYANKNVSYTSDSLGTPEISVHSSSASFTARWEPVKNADGYQVYYSDKANGTFKKADVKKGEETAFTVSGLKPETTYYVKVRAYRKDGKVNTAGGFSEVSEITTQSESGRYKLAKGEGKKLTILCYNDYIKSQVENIADRLPKNVEINYIIADILYIDDYRDGLSENLEPDGEDTVDLFMTEPDLIGEMVDFGASLTSLGITDKNRSSMFAYSRDMCTGSDGEQRAAVIINSPGVFLYDREVAKEVFGTDDPDKVQEHLSDWDKFLESAEKLKKKGYYIIPDTNSMYNAYDAKAKKRWVSSKGKIQIDENRSDWAKFSAKLVKNGYTPNYLTWSFEWMESFDSGEIFGDFAANWLAEYTIEMLSERKNWAVCQGPQGFIWGGNILAVNKNSDNYGLAAEIMRLLCVDGNIAEGEGDIPNNRALVKKSKGYEIEALGGQNPYGVYRKSLDSVDYSGRKNDPNYYDLTVLYRDVMVEYINGNVSFKEATADFKEKAKEFIK